jgi:V/A-type H+/Na+-transporting ATPase subunit A
VTSHTKEIVQTFWALSKELADARHYPSVDWNDSFSGYINATAKWWHENVDPRWAARRGEALGLLAQADELARIVNLVGPEALSPAQRWALEGAALIKEGVLQQSALDPVDSFSSPQKQFVLLDLMLDLYHQGVDLLAIGVPVQQLVVLPILSRARRVKAVYSSEDVEKLRGFSGEIHEAFAALRTEYGKPGGKAA